MISEWFTANELAVMNLPAIPNTQKGIWKRSQKSGWLSRPRSASGGGLEYHISSLPNSAQLALIEKLIERPELLVDSSREMRTETVAGVVYTDDDCRNAKLIIVRMFEKFMNTTTLSVTRAEKPYIDFYAAQRREQTSLYYPDWVFEIYPEFSVTSLRRWRAKREQRDALNALSNHYGNRKGTGFVETAEDGKLKTFIIAHITKNDHLKAGHIRDLCRAKFGMMVKIKDKNGVVSEKPLPNVRTFERFIKDWKESNKELHLRLTNPDAHKNRYMLSLGKADAGIERLNQVWEIDASPADVLCHDGRYAIYGIIDVYSRRVMYMTTKTPRTEAALLLIRKAIIEWGVPEMIKTDNGSDFKSKQFMSALIALGIEQYVCPPYSGDKKPFIERSFGTLQRDLMVMLPGFIGHNVADRKKIESRRSFAKRLGEDDANTFAIELSHTDLQARIDNWIAHTYNQDKHGGLNGQSPAEKVALWTAPIKRIENARALDMLLAPIAGGGGYRVVTKKGIRLDNGTFFSNAIIPYMGKKVFIRCNPEDMGTIFCFNEGGQFIGEATCFGREGVSMVEATASAKKAQREYEREHIEPLRKEMKKITPHSVADKILTQAALDAGHIVNLPKAGEAYSTPALEEAAYATRDISYRPVPTRPEIDLDAFEKEFHEINSATQPETMSDEDRWWERAKSLFAMKNDGKQLTPTDLQWLEWAVTQGWFTARRDHELMCITG